MLLTEDELNERIEIFEKSLSTSEKEEENDFVRGVIVGLKMANGGMSGFWDSWKELERKLNYYKK